MAALLTRPRLDQGVIAHGATVRFVGLVRDIGQPQLLLKDGAETYVETTPYRCEALPAQTAWASATATSAATAEVAHPTAAASRGSRKTKRRENEEEEECVDAAMPAPAVRVSEPMALPTTLAPTPFQVIVRAYGSTLWKVNHVYEFVGELDLTPQAAPDDMDIEWKDADSATVQEKARAIEFIPTLHATDASEISFGQDVGFREDMANPTAWAAAEWAQRLGQPTSVEEMRAQLLGYLATTAAHGDMVVAEYLLLVLLSRVYNRSDVSMPFGHLSLNVIWPSMSATDFTGLEQSLHALVPSCLSLDLSLAALHDALYFPQKDYDIEYLHPGLLQLPDGSTLVVNEANLTTGQLDDKGTHNMAALMTLVEHQALPYDFRFYKKEFNQDTKVICVSTSKSILPTTLYVPLQPTTTTTRDGPYSDALLQCFRIYLAVYRHFNTDLGNEGAALAEQWYIDQRRADATVGADDLHRLVRVVRLHAVSVGHATVTKDDWDYVVARHALVKARLHGLS
ncbi:hypothetical protein SDRG_05437 [Saprolegnia diclina VS20]|uniref:Mini-chromosome maintenance complex-binding protein n=1 Tax=Saprolegnia diclina (strain VS20) TaxID=1156394 RepID=T0QR32_SAPDV|nr:hypothetical protein SDRG_05437 [Saprolegnia diclina VS20]EQC37211.1 hypothetical protein SDRG_05437 [Saprolegnia diclina VS20]|eukprot:XP_008609373.1 hypothetical protein SDRG_05437 [Saprolegnia diclina VS20]